MALLAPQQFVEADAVLKHAHQILTVDGEEGRTAVTETFPSPAHSFACWTAFSTEPTNVNGASGCQPSGWAMADDERVLGTRWEPIQPL